VSRQRRSYEFVVTLDGDTPNVAGMRLFKELRIKAYTLGALFSSRYGATNQIRTYTFVIMGTNTVLDDLEKAYPQLNRTFEAPNAPTNLTHLEA